MKKLAIIGNFGNSRKQVADGQTIKTQTVSDELINQLGKDNVVVYNTNGGLVNLFKAPIVCLKAIILAHNVIIFPARRGVRVYAPLLAALSILFKNRRLHYSVIGGWLPVFISGRWILKRALLRFHNIYVETNTMKKALVEKGFNNVSIVQNCKKIEIVDLDKLAIDHHEPYQLCTFSRVNKEKGIADAVMAVQNVNNSANRIVYCLDIYGMIDPAQKEWFEELQSSFPEYIKYRGVVSFNKSVDVLKGYFALLFPTHYYTEGIPGTIIDSYAAGVPVISAKWQSFSDIIDDKKTGYGYQFDNNEELEEILQSIAELPSKISDLKTNCICKAENCLPQNTIKLILQNLI